MNRRDFFATVAGALAISRMVPRPVREMAARSYIHRAGDSTFMYVRAAETVRPGELVIAVAGAPGYVRPMRRRGERPSGVAHAKISAGNYGFVVIGGPVSVRATS